jgi:hypothetical protein
MGQYWKVVNLDRREYIHPHKLGAGLKLWEQVANHPGTGAALLILCAAMPEPRGGGDLNPLPSLNEQVIGRWAGDRIALIGDYAEDGDLKNSPVPASQIYVLCDDEKAWGWHDISDLVARQIEHELDGKFTGEGWKRFVRNDAG